MSSEPVAAPTCAKCNQPIADAQRVEHRGALYCANCVGKALNGTAPAQTPAYRSPVLAVFLSFLPGLGQMYNNQLLKGALIMGLFFLLGTGNLFAQKTSVLLGPHANQAIFPGDLFAAVLWFWNLFDAYWTAKRINRVGLPEASPAVQDLRLSMQDLHLESAMTPAWGVLLIILGVLFLLNNFNVFRLTWELTWPLAILGAGIWMLVSFALSRRAQRIAEATLLESQNGETPENQSS